MTKALSKAIMQMSQKQIFENPTNQNRATYTKQRNFC